VKPRALSKSFPQFIEKQEFAEVLGVHVNTLTAMCQDGRVITDHKGRLRYTENVRFLIAKSLLDPEDKRGGRRLDLVRNDVCDHYISQLEHTNCMLDEILGLIAKDFDSPAVKRLCAKLNGLYRETLPKYSHVTLHIRQ
jgi:hypothetical protein